MKSTVTTLLCFVVVLVAALPAEKSKYSSRFDSVDVDAILHNDRLLNAYIQCLKNEGEAGCTQEGKALKGVLREAIQTDCERCTEAQVRILNKVLPYLRKNKAADWKVLAAKYDPEGDWVKRHPLDA